MTSYFPSIDIAGSPFSLETPPLVHLLFSPPTHIQISTNHHVDIRVRGAQFGRPCLHCRTFFLPRWGCCRPPLLPFAPPLIYDKGLFVSFWAFSSGGRCSLSSVVSSPPLQELWWLVFEPVFLLLISGFDWLRSGFDGVIFGFQAAHFLVSGSRSLLWRR